MATLIHGEIMLLPPLDASKLQEGQQKTKKRRTTQQRQRQWQKNQDKHQFNQELSYTLPIFTAHKPCRVIFINYLTAFFVILRLIERARKTTFFSLDTETDDTLREPALIQIEFVQFETDHVHNQEEETTTIVIFEMCQLPSKTSVTYARVQTLFDTIFHPSKTFLTWGDERQQLLNFTIYPLFDSLPIISLNVINVQAKFKNWYNNTYRHDHTCYMSSLNGINDDPCCTCSYRPYKNSSDTWSLQRAVQIILHQFLDKSVTRNDWGQGLDLRLYQNIPSNGIWHNATSILSDKQERVRLKLVQYAIDDCFATTKLASTIGKYLFEDF